jgi:hypothetical protein
MQGGRCAAVHEMFADVFFQTLNVNMTATKNESKQGSAHKQENNKQAVRNFGPTQQILLFI